MDERETHRLTDNIPPPTSKEVDQAWENVISRIRIHEKEKKRKKIVRYSIAASATIILMIGTLVGYNTFLKPDIYLAQKSNFLIKLSDGTTVTLLKGAQLTVEKSFSSDTREVQLEGDALFEVAKSKEHPFIVHGLNYETKVLGTVFKVIQDGSTFKVDLFEGQVAVKKTNTKHEYVMAANQTFNNYGITDVATVTPLKQSTSVSQPHQIDDSMIRLSFNDSSIKNAIEVVEKTYHIKIVYPAEYGDHKISLDNVNVSPAAVLGTIAAHLNLQLKIYGRTYRLEK